MVVIRLSRVGKKNSPAYRVVVAEKRRAVKRKFIEVIGHYNPTRVPKEVVIDKERALFWMEKGAKPSPTVNNLMADLEIIKKSNKINIKYAKDKKKKELKAEKENKGEDKASEKAEVKDDNEVKKAEESQSEADKPVTEAKESEKSKIEAETKSENENKKSEDIENNKDK